jgi:hypothetical protein
VFYNLLIFKAAARVAGELQLCDDPGWLYLGRRCSCTAR